MADLYAAARKRYPEAVGNLESSGKYRWNCPYWLGRERRGWGYQEGAVTPVMNFAKIEKRSNQAIVGGIRKGIKPTVIGKSDAGLTAKYYDNAKTAVT